MPEATAKHEILDELCRSGVRFHGGSGDALMNWQLGADALALLLDSVRPGDRTLETGCGYSTVAFALAGANHTVVSPAQREHERIREWCAAHGVSTRAVTFVVGHYEDCLPNLGDGPLDFALIDGADAFPIPFLDWYYAAARLRTGGLVMVDDTHLLTGEILRDFLASESSRWRRVRELPTTAVFERLGSDLIPHQDWCGQPYCARPGRLPPGAPLRARLRHRIRLRTRLRALAGRAGRQRPR